MKNKLNMKNDPIEVIKAIEQGEMELADVDPDYYQEEYVDGLGDFYIVHQLDDGIDVFDPPTYVYFGEHDFVKENREKFNEGEITEAEFQDFQEKLNDLEGQFNYDEVVAYRQDGEIQYVSDLKNKEKKNEFEYMEDVDLITFLETDGILKDGIHFNAHGEQGIKEMVRGFGYEPSEVSVIYNDLGDEYAINVNTGVYDDKGIEKGTGVEILVDKESGKASIYELEVYDKDQNVVVDEKKVDGEFQLFVDVQYLEGKNLSKSNDRSRNVEFDYGL